MAGVTVLLIFLTPVMIRWMIGLKIDSLIKSYETRMGLTIKVRQISIPATDLVEMRQIIISDQRKKSSSELPITDTLFSAGMTVIHLNLLKALHGSPVDKVVMDTVAIHTVWDSSGLNIRSLFMKSAGADSLPDKTADTSSRSGKSYINRLLPENVPDLEIHHLDIRFINIYRELIPARKTYRVKQESMALEQADFSLKKILAEQTQIELNGLLKSDTEQANALFSAQLNYSTRQALINVLFDRSFKLPVISRWLDMDVALKGADMMMREAESDSNRDHLNLQVMLHDLALSSEAVASKKIQGLDVQTLLNLDIDSGRIMINPQTSIGVGQIKIFIEGTIRNPDGSPDYSLALRLDTISMNDFFASIPSVFMTRLEGIRVQGSMSYDLKLRLNMERLDSTEILPSLKLSRDFRVVTLGDSVNVTRLRGDFEHRIVTESGTDSTLIIGKDNPYYTPYDSIPLHLVYAVLLSEDGSFFRNDGFNLMQIERSVADNIRQKKFVRGASTVSMQFVKNLFLSLEKTLSRKFQELILTWLINKERLLDENKDKEKHKKRMLEIYLNVIEWGPDIHGIGKAAEFYFNKRPPELTVTESAFLATIIPNPKKYKRYFFEGNLRKNKKDYMNLLARMMAGQQIISQAESLEAADTPLRITGKAMDIIRFETTGDTSRIPVEDDIRD